MKNLLKQITILAATTICAGCALMHSNTDNNTSGSVISNGSEKLALMYNPYSTTIHPKVFVKKKNLNDIDLYVIINDAELLFSKANAQKANIANVRIFYKIMESYEKTTLIDSCAKNITITKDTEAKTYAIKIKVKPTELTKFVIQTTVTDVIRGKMSLHFTNVDKTDPYSDDNYMITRSRDHQPQAEHYLKLNDDVRIDYLAPSQFAIINTSTLPHPDEIPESPYASTPATNDTIIFNNNTSQTLGYTLHPNKTQIYATTADTNKYYNFALPCFGGDFPNINTPDEMIQPLAYIATPEEYSELSTSNNRKLAVDDFWYTCTHDIKRAKELIKIYYTRAIFSNILFTDHRKGIFTDRGMVYIVLGPPKILAITSNTEIWTYKNTKTGQNVKFVFQRQKSQFGSETYVLRRSTELKPYWDKAVQTWRKGSIFTF